MDVTTALRPAQRFLTTALVAAVTATCLVSAATGHAAPSPAGHVQAKKEYGPAKKEYSLQVKKEYRNTPGKKEHTFSAKKEYQLHPGKKEYTFSAKKEYRLHPGKKEYSATA